MKTLDPALPPDVAAILDSSGLLDISEFRVFELACEAWFGAPDAARVDKAFVAYMYDDLVPPWVRAFTREVLARDRAGLLDPTDYGIHYAPPTPTMIYLGIRYAVLTALTLILIVVAAHYADTGTGCMFPPCY